MTEIKCEKIFFIYLTTKQLRKKCLFTIQILVNNKPLKLTLDLILYLYLHNYEHNTIQFKNGKKNKSKCIQRLYKK